MTQAPRDDTVLPPGWARTTLGEIGQWASGGTPSRGRKEFFGGSIPWVKTGDLKDGVVTDVPESLTDEGLASSSATLFPERTLLMAMYGATIGRLGVLAQPSATNQACAALLPNGVTGDLLPFVFYYLMSIRHALKNAGKGGAQPNISQTVIKRFPIVVAPLGEQRRIVEAADSYLSRLDDAVATLERVQRNLNRYRASVLKAAVEGRLVPTEAELARKERRDYESADVLLARILEERKARWIEHEAEKGRAKAAGKAAKAGKPWTEADDQAALVKARTAAVTKYKEPAPPDTSKLPELPEGWSWTTLEALTSPERVICYGILMPKEHVPDGVPYVKVRDMRSGVLDVPNLPRTSLDIDAKYARSRLRAGDLLLAIRGTWGRVVEIPPELEGGNITQDSARLALHTDLNRRYFKYAILSDTIQRYFSRVARGVAVKGVNIGDVRLAPVPLPPIAEQERVAVYVDDMLSLEAAVEQSVVADTSRCARLRQSILKWAFEGKLVDQDPNDEPASLLLDRIKAERDTAQAAAKAKKKPARKPRKKKSA